MGMGDSDMQFIVRQKYLDELIELYGTPDIKVITGIRRSGKSTLFRLMINHLSINTAPQEILYANLDDPFFIK